MSDDDLPAAAQLGALDRWSFVRRVVVSERDPGASKPSGPGPQHQPLGVPPPYIGRDGTKMLEQVSKPAPAGAAAGAVGLDGAAAPGSARHRAALIMLNPGVPPRARRRQAREPARPPAARARAAGADPFGIPRADGGAGARRVRSRWKPPADKITVAELRQTASLPALPSAGAMAQSGAWKKAKTNSKLVIAGNRRPKRAPRRRRRTSARPPPDRFAASRSSRAATARSRSS